MEELRNKLSQIYQTVKEAVDLTVDIRKRSPQDKKYTIEAWQNFLGSFFKYIKQKSKEERENLLAGISFKDFFK